MITSNDIEFRTTTLYDENERPDGEMLMARIQITSTYELSDQVSALADAPRIRQYAQDKIAWELRKAIYGDVEAELIELRAGMMARIDPRNGGEEMVEKIDEVIGMLRWDSVA
jgi:hypothetical protein